MIMGIIGWIVVALLVAFIAGKFVNLRGDDPRLGYAVACGAVLYTLSGAGVSAWNPWSLLCAAAGAVAAVATWHALRSRYASHESYTRRSSYSKTGR